MIPELAQNILDYTREHESAGYGDSHAGVRHLRPKPLDQMTVDEVLAWQRNLRAQGVESTAAGGYQIIHGTLEGLKKNMGLTGSERFDKPLQDRMGFHLMREAGWDEFAEGRLSAEEYGTRLAKTWAVLPVLQPTNRQGRAISVGESYYSGVGSNRANGDTAGFKAVLTGSRGPIAANNRLRPPVGFTGLSNQINIWEGYNRFDDFDLAPAFRSLIAQPAHAPTTFWGDVGREFQDSLAARIYQYGTDGRPWEYDRDFNPYEEMARRGIFGHSDYLGGAQSLADFEHLMMRLRQEQRREEMMAVRGRFWAVMVGALLAPENLFAYGMIPGRALSIGGSALSYGGAAMGTEAINESLRRSIDPNGTMEEGVMNVGFATLFGVGIGGMVGAIGRARAGGSAATRKTGPRNALYHNPYLSTDQVRRDIERAAEPGADTTLKGTKPMRQSPAREKANRAHKQYGEGDPDAPDLTERRNAVERHAFGGRRAGEPEARSGDARASEAETRKVLREFDQEIEEEMAWTMGRGGFFTDLRFGRADIRVRMTQLPNGAPETARRNGVWLNARTNEVYVDPTRTAQLFQMKAWRKFGIADDAFQNVQEFSEFMVRYTLQLEAEGVSLASLPPQRFVAGPRGLIEIKRAPKGEDMDGLAYYEVRRDADGGVSEVIALDMEALRADYESGGWREPLDRADPSPLVRPRGTPDDLTRIRGIGQALAARLYEMGVYHFDQIAGWTDAELAEVSAALRGFKNRAVKDDWIGQARALADEAGTSRVDPIPTEFERFEDFVNFVITHEQMHARYKRDPYEAIAQYENRINQRALKALGLDRESVQSSLRKERELRLRASDRAMKEFTNWRKNKWGRNLKRRVSRIIDRMVPTTYKRLMRTTYTPSVRQLAQVLAHDGSLAQLEPEVLATVGESMAMAKATWRGLPDQLARAQTRLYEAYLGHKTNMNLAGISVRETATRTRADGQPAISPDEFAHRATMFNITGDMKKYVGDIPQIRELADAQKEMYARFDKAAREVGVYGPMTPEIIEARTAHVERQMAIAQEKLAEAEDAAAAAKRNVKNDEMVRRYQAEIDRLSWALTDLDNARVVPLDQQATPDYFTRVFDQNVVRMFPETLKDIVRRAYRRNPYFAWKDPVTGKIEKRLLDQQTLEQRVQETVDAILSDETGRMIDASADGLGDAVPRRIGQSAPARLRRLNISNRELVALRREDIHPNEKHLFDKAGSDEIHLIATDPKQTAVYYANRMGGIIEYFRRFGDPGLGISADEGFDRALRSAQDIEKTAWVRRNGSSDKSLREFDAHWARVQRDLIDLRDRVLHRTVLQPGRWDNRATRVIKGMSNMAYLGQAGFVNMIDSAQLVAAFGHERVWAAAQAALDPKVRPIFLEGAQSAEKIGALADMSLGVTIQRLTETAFDPVYQNAFERAVDWGSSKFFIANMMAPVTHGIRTLAAVLGQEEILTAALRAVDEGDEASASFLRGLGVSDDVMRAIAREKANGNVRLSPEGIWLADTDAWQSANAARAYNSALHQLMDNIVLVASIADKPTLAEGHFYVPKIALTDALAARYEWTDVGGYYRVQSGLLSLPFHMMSYVLAATQKITLRGMENPSARALGAMLVMTAMGYLISSARVPDYIWEQMSPAEKALRAIDQSGVMGVIPEYLWGSQSLTMGLTGFNPYPIDPRFKNVGRAERVADLLGPGVDFAKNVATGTFDTVTGGEDAGKTLSRTLPGNNLFLFGEWIRSLLPEDFNSYVVERAE